MSPVKFKSFGVTTALFALLACGCQQRGANVTWWEREQERLALTHELALKDYRFQQSGYGEMEELKLLQASNAAGKQDLQHLLKDRSNLDEQISSLSGLLAQFQEQHLRDQRSKAMGQKFEVLTAMDGRNFRQASVTKIDDGGVTIRHEDGSARLQFADLDEKQRQFFGMEEGKAQAAEQEERRQAIAYEKWIDSSVAMNRTAELQASEKTKREASSARQRTIAMSQLASVQKERALAQPAKSFSGYSSYSSSYRTSRPSYRYVYYYNNSRSSYGCSPYSVYRPQQVDISKAHKRNFAETTVSNIP